jgi:hypothetical protein
MEHFSEACHVRALARWWHSVTGPGGYAVEEEFLDH